MQKQVWSESKLKFNREFHALSIVFKNPRPDSGDDGGAQRPSLDNYWSGEGLPENVGTGLDTDSSQVVEGDCLAGSSKTGTETLLNRRPDLDAVFASNDRMALGVLHTARRRRLSIPN